MAEHNFDFEEHHDAPESLDFSKKAVCPHCKKPIAHDATMCYFCGEDVPPAAKPKWVVWATAIFIIVLVAVIIFVR